MDDGVLRKNLLELLSMGSTHIGLDEALSGLSPADAFLRPAASHGEVHSVWELLEHMRITQEDIVRYTMDSSWTSPDWPAEYWPSHDTSLQMKQQDEMWRRTREAFEADLEEVRGWVRDKGMDLTAQIPHGEGRTYLRQVLLVADHNSYHLAQIVSARRLLGLWR